MLDSALNVITSAQSYYFQLYPLNLSIVDPNSELPAKGTTYRFNVMKGQTKFDETRPPIQANFTKLKKTYAMDLPKCPLNFYVPTFTKGRKMAFTFSMHQTENKTEYFIADHQISIESYVEAFKADRMMRFEHKVPFSEDYELEFEVYIERSRFALEKVVKDYKQERTLKSPLRERKESPKGTSQIRRTSPQEGKRKLTKNPSESIRSQHPSEKEQNPTQVSGSKNERLSSRKGSEAPSLPSSEIRAGNHPKATSRTDESENKSNAGRGKLGATEQAFTKKMPIKAPSQASSKKDTSAAVEVKYKPLSVPSKGESEIKMISSQKLGSTIIEKETASGKVSNQSAKRGEKAFLIAFLVGAVIMMYFSMQPSRKV